jgi:flagellar motor switch protein FliN/FliY
MTADETLIQIGETAGAAVAGVLEGHCPGAVTTHAPAAGGDDSDPVAGIALPVLVADGSEADADGATAGNLFFMPLPAVRALAAALMGVDPTAADTDPHTELTDLEVSAAGEVAGEIMAAAAAAMSTVTGEEAKAGAPRTRVVAIGAELLAPVDPATAVVSVSIDLLGYACRLVQLMPQALVARTASAVDELAEQAPGADTPEQAGRSVDVLGTVGLRVAAELGRVRMTIRRAANLPPGAVVELDRDLEDPIDLYVNGRRFATGRLVTLDGGEWAVSIDTVSFSQPS